MDKIRWGGHHAHSSINHFAAGQGSPSTSLRALLQLSFSVERDSQFPPFPAIVRMPGAGRLPGHFHFPQIGLTLVSVKTPASHSW